MKSIQSFLFILIVSLNPLAAGAGAVIDSRLKNQLRAYPSQKILVAVRYQKPRLRLESESSTAFIRRLQNENKILQDRFFRPSQRPFSLWIANSTVVALAPREIRALSFESEIEGFSLLGRSARLIPDAPARAVENLRGDSHTYGLRRLDVPRLNQLYPEINGQGLTVGIIDTGVDANHPDLRGKIAAFKDFISPRNERPRDDHGHGSHVAGTVAGGQTSGTAIGVAPSAQLKIAKGFDSSGGSEDQNLLRALQWMMEGQLLPRVISNSWNLDNSEYKDANPDEDVFCVAIQNMTQMGVAVVFAAGNDGPDDSSIKLPAACPEAISVGATNEQDGLVFFSSRGPVRWKNASFVKPEVVAPGEDVLSASPGGGYRHRSGTSMAAPHVAGLLALLFQARPQINHIELLGVLTQGAKPMGRQIPNNQSGFGRVNALASVELIKKSGPTK